MSSPKQSSESPLKKCSTTCFDWTARTERLPRLKFTSPKSRHNSSSNATIRLTRCVAAALLAAGCCGGGWEEEEEAAGEFQTFTEGFPAFFWLLAHSLPHLLSQQYSALRLPPANNMLITLSFAGSRITFCLIETFPLRIIVPKPAVLSTSDELPIFSFRLARFGLWDKDLALLPFFPYLPPFWIMSTSIGALVSLWLSLPKTVCSFHLAVLLS